MLRILLIIIMLSSTAHAVEFDIQAEKTWWQYQEYAQGAPLTATQASLLPSKSQGEGAQLQLNLSSNRDEDWFFALSGALMDSTSVTTERWSAKQVNDISIRQFDVRVDAQYAVMNHARLGIFLARRQQEQSREKFVVNGVAVAVAGEPIIETINSSWFGVSFVGTGGINQQLEVNMDIAVPIQVDVTNPLFTAPFSKRDGYRTALDFRWNLPKSEVGVSGLNMTLSYQYQELGGEKQSDVIFWPYNRWQMLGFGLLYAW